VKHPSPLFTLAAVAVAFIIMFTVDVLAGPPGGNSAQPAAPSAPLSPATATSPSPQASETAAATPSASASTEESSFPKKVVYAGHTEGRSGAIAVAVLGNQSAAYFCDGRGIESWLRGDLKGAGLSLRSKDAATLQASLDGVTINGESLNAQPVNGNEDL
jgi:hypothetical protein